MDLEKKIRQSLDTVKDHGWQVLNLKNCSLTKIPDEVYNYTDLVTIDLSNDEFCEEELKNKITEIPDSISRLANLKRLNLADNQIKYLSPEICRLRKLTYLNICNNQLTDISEKIANMPSLKELCMEGNPFELLPPEIVARGIDSVRNFFKELDEKDYLYEVKLLLVGQGRVGKTCLSEALTTDIYELNDNDSTEGINIQQWIIPNEKFSTINKDIKRDFKVNIWDFGGQEIYHSTHQFFLTKRSIYLLVTESRKEDSHDEFYYWLNIIKLLGDNSPVIIVLNKCDQPTKEIPIKEYKESFNNISGFYKISLEKGYEDKLNLFKDELIKQVSYLPHIGTPLPKRWVDIRNDLENLKLSGKNYISLDEYFNICKKHYRIQTSALFLSEYFHDLGVILHFQKDIELKETVILNHEWITKAVYKLLDDQKIIDQNGMFDDYDIERIWSTIEFKNKRLELLSLMKNKKFDLCFSLPNGGYLIPRLLPVDEVGHNWISSPENMKFEFRYKFMPKGILTRLIVKMNSDIYDNKYWRYGVIFKYEDTLAFVREKYFENKITVELSGSSKREYLYAIRKTIKEIHTDYNNIQVQEMIPCICPLCKTIDSPYFFKNSLLQRYEQRGLTEIRCDLSLENVSIALLTSDIIKKNMNGDKTIICENKNAELLNSLGWDKILFFGERDSASVFVKVVTKPEYYGLRDKDFLLESEILRIQSKYPNIFILEYYCIENYLYHPDNISAFLGSSINIAEYLQDIIRQKNENKNLIISNYKNSRKSYQEFKIPQDNFEDKANENSIMDYLESDDIEVFFKAFSFKDHYKKDYLKKYNLKGKELANTEWFKHKLERVLRLD
jgi:internalin A